MPSTYHVTCLFTLSDTISHHKIDQRSNAAMSILYGIIPMSLYSEDSLVISNEG